MDKFMRRYAAIAIAGFAIGMVILFGSLAYCGVAGVRTEHLPASILVAVWIFVFPAAFGIVAASVAMLCMTVRSIWTGETTY